LKQSASTLTTIPPPQPCCTAELVVLAQTAEKSPH